MNYTELLKYAVNNVGEKPLGGKALGRIVKNPVTGKRLMNSFFAYEPVSKSLKGDFSDVKLGFDANKAIDTADAHLRAASLPGLVTSFPSAVKSLTGAAALAGSTL